MEIPLDRNGSTPLYLQIKNHLKDRIERGGLAPGAKLPPTRQLASDLSVNRITIVNAYAELEAEGLVQSHVGRGTFVTTPSLMEEWGADRHEEDKPPWSTSLAHSPELSANAMVREMLRLAQQPGVISFALGGPAADCLPVNDFRRAINTVLRQDGPQALCYEVTEGYYPLRKSLAAYLAERGIHAQAENVLITSGSQQGVDLVARVLVQEGEHVITESPTYLGAIDAFEARRARIIGVPVDDGGIRVEMVENVIRQHHPRLIYTMPTFHNPTGVCMANDRRRRLLSLAQRYGLIILEDATYSELRYNGREQPALKALDGGGSVIYMGSFSKILLPGIRVGYLVAPGGLYERLISAKQTADLHTSSLLQRALDCYLGDGQLGPHLRKVCRVYRGRREAMIESLTRYLPAGVHWSNPAGGFHLWLTLPANISVTELYLESIKDGVAFAIGSVFFPDWRGHNHLRLNFAIHPPPVIEEGIRRLGKALKERVTREGEEPAILPQEPIPALV